MSHKVMLAAVLAAVFAGCGGSSQNQAELGGAQMNLSYERDSDVAGFHFLVTQVACSPGQVVKPFTVEALVALQDQRSPGGVDVLNVFDDGSGHVFADLFISLSPGCYDIVAEPAKVIDFDKKTYQPSDSCSGASAKKVEVLKGKTTHVKPLICQCSGNGPGGLDVPAALNHPPQVSVEVTDKFAFQCEPLKVCAVASDVDNDPIQLVWAQVSGATLPVPIDVDPGLTLVGQTGGVRQYKQCARVAMEDFGSYGFSVTAFDLLKDGTRIENAIDPTEEHNKSRFAFEFSLFVNAGGEPLCVDENGGIRPIENPIPRAQGCDWIPLQVFYCDATYAQKYRFDLASTCPGGVFHPEAVYPPCEKASDAGFVAVTGFNDGNIYVLDAATLAQVDTIDIPQVVSPIGISEGPDGLLYVGLGGSAGVVRIDPASKTGTSFGGGGNPFAGNLYGLTVGGNNTVYGSGSGMVDVKTTDRNGVVGAPIGSPGGSNLRCTAFNRLTGDFYLTSFTGGPVQRYNSSFVYQGAFGASSGLASAFGIATRSNGDVVVISQNETAYYVFNSVGTFQRKIGVPQCANMKWGAATDQKDNFYIACASSSKVVKFDSSDAFVAETSSPGAAGVTWMATYPVP